MQKRFSCGTIQGEKRGRTLASEQELGAQPVSPFRIVFAPLKLSTLLAAEFVCRDWPLSAAMLTWTPRSQIAKESLQISWV